MNKVFVIVMLFSTWQLHAQKQITLSSPDKNIVYTFRLTEKAPVYRVAYKGKALVDDSPLGLDFKEGGHFGQDITYMNKPIFDQADENYHLLVGKTSMVRNHYRQVTIRMKEKAGMKRLVNLIVRAYDDGIAFRYDFPQQDGWKHFDLTDEGSTFNLVGDPMLKTLFLPNYTSSHEGVYTTRPLSQVKEDALMDMPTLFMFPGNNFLAITEAALLDYAGMYLVRHNGILHSQLSPLPGQEEIKVKAGLPHHSPWRVLMISDRIGALIESNIITSLNEPNKISDTSWIKPGKTSFHWWNGDITPDTSFTPGINFQTNKYYIDFCAANGLEYHSVIGYGNIAWYVNDGIGYQPGPHSDPSQPIPGLDMQQICDYGKQKGVGIRVWVHWAALYPKLEKTFAQYEKWGIKGMMVDFMDRDDQEMVNIQTEILECAARHKMHIQFHGAYKPTGLSRTYPNEFTREGTLNYEANKGGTRVNPDHDLNIPFTRMLAGPTDYHLGGFRAVPLSTFKPQHTRPLMLGTRCHMLAMYVVLESYLAMVCDYPDAYIGQPGFDFIKEVPTVWDETRVPAARVDEYLTLARRKGNDWCLGTITNNTAREITIPLDFLSDGEYVAEIYADAPDDAENPNHLTRQTIPVTRKDTIKATLAAGGGQAIYLHRK